jgi:NADH-quinone oxidoreductase subunit J
VIQVIAFYLFAVITVLSGVLCVTARNPVHSVLWLILQRRRADGAGGC